MNLASLLRRRGRGVWTYDSGKRHDSYGNLYRKRKLDELKWLVWEKEADGIVCDDELSPVQLKNLEEALDCKIMDRTLVILDILRRERPQKRGKIQVELAQLKYRQSRSDRPGKSLSRLGGRYRDERAGRKETGDGQKTY